MLRASYSDQRIGRRLRNSPPDNLNFFRSFFLGNSKYGAPASRRLRNGGGSYRGTRCASGVFRGSLAISGSADVGAGRGDAWGGGMGEHRCGCGRSKCATGQVAHRTRPGSGRTEVVARVGVRPEPRSVDDETRVGQGAFGVR